MTETLLKTTPAVFAVGDQYQIMVPVSAPCVMWVQTGQEVFYDDWQGILRSDTDIHRISVPMKKLDQMGAYMICYRKIIERRPYFTESEEVVCLNYSFRPVTQDQEKICAYHIADAHSNVDTVVRAGRYFGKELDLLILNGDIPNHSGKTEYLENIYLIIEALTGGHIPVLFARGNHDCRGENAEHMRDYIPLDNENTYYTFHLGPIWGVVLDCGEDKLDDHPEYGFMNCFHSFRIKQTAFLEKVGEICKQENDPALAKASYRMVVVHIPFTRILEAPFDIEGDIYDRWAQILREEIHPDFMLCGHMHEISVYEQGGIMDHRGQACPVVVGADPLYMKKELCEDNFVGTALIFEKGKIYCRFTDAEGKVRGSFEVK